MNKSWILFDAGLFIGALLKNDPRHIEARPLVEAGRSGILQVCTTIGILSEVYAALTWSGAKPPQSPKDVASAIRTIVEPPSAIRILPTELSTLRPMLNLAVTNQLTARRIHDARHAATALAANVNEIYTYDVGDWGVFSSFGIQISGPPSVLATTFKT